MLVKIKQDTNTNNDILRFLDDSHVNCLVLDVFIDRSLVQFFRKKAEWELDFEDGEVVVFIRNIP